MPDSLEDIPIHSSEAASSLPTMPDNLQSYRHASSSAPKLWQKRGAVRMGTILLTCLGMLILMLVLILREESSPELRVVHSFLIEQGVSAMALQDGSSVQHEAAQWLATQLDLPPDNNNVKQAYQYLTKYVMVLNYFAMDGQDWTFDDIFLKDAPVCEWHDVKLVLAEPTPLGLFCSKDTNTPLELYLNYVGLKGEIPSENGLLTTLTILDFKVNYLKGTIPTELCQMNNLEELALGFNELTGSIPTCLDQWTNLELLLLSRNQLTGTVPSTLAGLESLSRLLLDDNMLTGDGVTILNSIPSLDLVYLEKNQLTGQIDDDFCKDLTALRSLDLSSNNITSHPHSGIPTHLLQMPELEVLDLSDNALSGHVPSELGRNNALFFLSLHHNQLNGGIPSELANMVRLFYLDLSNNGFHGPLRNELGDLDSLRYLLLASNPNLHAQPIPDSFANLVYLEELSLQQTARTGALPEWLPSSLTGLVTLDLSHNDLNGTIPESYASLDRLQDLSLSGNPKLTGNLPDGFSNMTALSQVYLHETGLSGDLQVLCDLMQAPSSVFHSGLQTITVNCKEDNGSGVKCACCQCCQNEDSCPGMVVNHLDAQWEDDFSRNVYEDLMDREWND